MKTLLRIIYWLCFLAIALVPAYGVDHIILYKEEYPFWWVCIVIGYVFVLHNFITDETTKKIIL